MAAPLLRRRGWPLSTSAAFQAQANGQGLARIGSVFTCAGSDITQAQAQACVRQWKYFGTSNDITAVEAHIAFLRSRNFVANNDGLNGGVGIRADKIPSGNATGGKPIAAAAGRGRNIWRSRQHRDQDAL